MSESKSVVFIHLVWSTKHRANSIPVAWKRHIYRHISATAEGLGWRVVAINGTSNHVHLLIRIPADVDVVEVAKRIKGSSSRFVNTTLDQTGSFRWQEGYAAYSVGLREIRSVVRYIRDQEIHHGVPNSDAVAEDPDTFPNTP